MTVTPSSPRPRARTLLGIGTAALLCTGLGACSTSGRNRSTPPSVASARVATAATATTATSTTTATTTATATSTGPSAAPGANAGSTHPCALLTRAEAASAVGQPLTSGSENAALGNCGYSTPDFAAGVSITVSSWDSITNAAHSNGHTPPAVSGIGDQAYFGVGLSVRKGNKGFLLLMNGPHIDSLPDRGLAKEKALAALIVPRM